MLQTLQPVVSLCSGLKTNITATTSKQKTLSSLHLPVRRHKQFGQIQDIQGFYPLPEESMFSVLVPMDLHQSAKLDTEHGKDWVRLKLNNLYFVSTKCFSNVFLIHVSYLIVERFVL